MASLYKEENWSNNLESVADDIVKRLSGPKVSWTAAGEKLKKYYNNYDNYSLTHFWAAIAVTEWVKEVRQRNIQPFQSRPIVKTHTYSTAAYQLKA